MIIFPSGFVLSPEALLDAMPLTHPRIGYQNLAANLDPALITVSGEVAGAPKDAPTRPESYEYWQGPSLPATWDADLGAMYPINYVGIAAHDIGSCGASAKVFVSDEAGDFDSYVSMPGSAGNYVSTPDTPANSITGDLDVRILVACNDWTPANAFDFFDKETNDTTNFSYLLRLGTDGKLTLYWSADGTSLLSRVSTVAPTVSDGGKLWLRATLDVDNGAGGHDVKFYTSADYNPETGSGTWTQLGSTVTTAGTTSIFNSTATLHLGGDRSGVAGQLAGRFYFFELRNGIGGAVVAVFNPDDAANGDSTSWNSSQTGEAWTINQNGSPNAHLAWRRLAQEVNPGTNAPLLFLDEEREGRYLRLKLRGIGGVPKIGVIYVGRTLDMQRPFYGGHTPFKMSRDTEHYSPLSRNGQFLGQLVRANGIEGSVRFQHLTAAWVRSTLDPFIKASRSAPYFFAWRPATFPDEVVYGWNRNDIRPGNMGRRDFMEVSWQMRAFGYD